jgi:glycosyltransferase involved in cell wall biosynthesis
MSLSIIVTTHNRAVKLSNLLTKILFNNIDYEVIVVDDYSEIKIAYTYNESNLRYIWAPNIKGPSSSRNIGVQVASKKRIIFLDDDDDINIDWILFNINIEESEQVLFTNYIRNIDGMSYMVSLEDVTYETQMVSNRIPIGAFSVPSNQVKYIYFDEKLDSHEDWEYLLKIGDKLKFKYIKNMIAVEVNISNSGRNESTRASFIETVENIYRLHRTQNPFILQMRSNIINELKNNQGK